MEHVAALYDGEIAQVDAALADLLQAARRPELQPMLVVLTSDHGESLGEHGYHFAHGEYLYRSTLRVPLIFVLPGQVPAGVRVDAMAENVDVSPTILDLLGLSRMQSADGRPLLVAGARSAGATGRLWEPSPGRKFVFAESDFQLIHPENRRYYIPGPSGRWSSVFDGRFELIHIPRPGGGIMEFYDLESDPGETHNLEGSGAVTESRRRLEAELLKYVDYGAGTPNRPLEADPEEERRLRSLGYIN